jgi:hypothetical protein
MSRHEVRTGFLYDEDLPVKCPECGKVVHVKRRWLE